MKSNLAFIIIYLSFSLSIQYKVRDYKRVINGTIVSMTICPACMQYNTNSSGVKIFTFNYCNYNIEQRWNFSQVEPDIYEILSTQGLGNPFENYCSITEGLLNFIHINDIGDVQINIWGTRNCINFNDSQMDNSIFPNTCSDIIQPCNPIGSVTDNQTFRIFAQPTIFPLIPIIGRVAYNGNNVANHTLASVNTITLKDSSNVVWPLTYGSNIVQGVTHTSYSANLPAGTYRTSTISSTPSYRYTFLTSTTFTVTYCKSDSYYNDPTTVINVQKWFKLVGTVKNIDTYFTSTDDSNFTLTFENTSTGVISSPTYSGNPNNFSITLVAGSYKEKFIAVYPFYINMDPFQPNTNYGNTVSATITFSYSDSLDQTTYNYELVFDNTTISNTFHLYGDALTTIMDMHYFKIDCTDDYRAINSISYVYDSDAENGQRELSLIYKCIQDQRIATNNYNCPLSDVVNVPGSNDEALNYLAQLNIQCTSRLISYYEFIEIDNSNFQVKFCCRNMLTYVNKVAIDGRDITSSKSYGDGGLYELYKVPIHNDSYQAMSYYDFKDYSGNYNWNWDYYNLR